MTFVVLMREDSIGIIHQRLFPNLVDAKHYYDLVKKKYFFTKLCVVIEENS